MLRWLILSLCVTTLVLGPSWSLLAQSDQQPPAEPPAKSREKDQKKSDKEPDWPRSPESLEYEVQYKAAVAHRQAERRKAVEAADQILTLARPLSQPDATNAGPHAKASLEKIEKLAKRIRSFGGGDESEHALETTPATLAQGAAQIVALAENLKRRLEEFDHRVISVTVIDDSNTIILLSEHLRQQARP
jgi:hypothetical protein